MAIIWLVFVVLGVASLILTKQAVLLTTVMIASAKDTPVLSGHLLVMMMFWLGFMKIAKAGGVIRLLTRIIKRPLMRQLFPRLLALIFSVKLLLYSDIFKSLTSGLTHLFFNSVPADLWPLLILKPVSGSAALAMTEDIFSRFGPDSSIVLMASVIQGATDTTLYIVTVYFGAVGIKQVTTALKVGLIADFIGIMTAVFIAKWFFSL